MLRTLERIVSPTVTDFRLHSNIAEIPATAWDALAGPQPFLRHAFLDALEASGCVGGDTGWTPMHAALWKDEHLLAAMPLYAKTHSYGEYVFDWAWADAYERNGLAYYPKALCAIPFTPVPGTRILAVEAAHRRGLLEGVIALCREARLSSFHLLFPQESDAAAGEALGLMVRQGVQFHWERAGERSFEDFLGRLNHEKRKKIRQERRKVSGAGVSFVWREGHDITPEDWRFFERCYRRTYALHRSTPYLNLDFFLRIGQALPEACVLVLALREGKPLAASLMLRDDEALYGRYWGALEYVPCLHFEACYYQGIEYAIARGLLRFEGGAQGEHKLARGLEPVKTQSLHWIGDRRFRNAVEHFLEREAGGIDAYLDELSERSPFKHGADEAPRGGDAL